MAVQAPPDTSIGRNALAVLAGLPLFEAVDPASLAAIATQIQWFGLPGGAALFEEGDEADALYIVTSGALGAWRRGSDGRERLIGRITRGETVGEMAFLSGRPRSATVRCLRDSELMRFTRSAFDTLLQDHPAAMLGLARLTVERLNDSLRQRPPRLAPKTFAVLAAGPGTDAAGFAERLVDCLSEQGKAELFSRGNVGQHTSVWFNEIEARRDHVVYLADGADALWAGQCIRQADVILLLARADSAPGDWRSINRDLAAKASADNLELVLLHEGRMQPGAARRWLDACPAETHHHVKDAGDIARIARLLTGSATGIVFSGGGARGFAHIGVIRALREAGIAVDMAGGTSIGSITAAGVAAGWGDQQLVERHRRAFVDANPLGDYTLPFMSLSSGRRVSRLLRREVGDLVIEDLRLPFFCVSANLTRGTTAVHRSGPLWRWLRASIAIPGVLPPVFHDGEIYVDGGIVNHLPVEVMRELQRGAVIGVDVGSDRRLAVCEMVDELSAWERLRLLRRNEAPNILQILLRAGTVTTSAVNEANRRQSNILLTPPLPDIDILNWRAFDRAIEAGYEHTMEHMDAIRDALAGEGRALVV